MKKGKAGRMNGPPRLREAVNWFVDHETDQEERKATEMEWEAWSSRADNIADYLKVLRLRDELAALPRPSLPSVEALLGAVGEANRGVVYPPSLATSTPRLTHSKRRLHRWAPVVAAVAAVFTLAAVFLYWVREAHRATNLEQSVATVPGEQRQFFLPDGSRIRMGGDTGLAIKFTAHARTIELDHGEAFFQVQRDPRRPFAVDAAGGTTTAIGTAFEVRRHADHVQVWVREGAVVVAPVKLLPVGSIIPAGDAVKPPTMRVAGGEQMSYDSRGEASTPTRADPRIAAAWSEGHLVPLIYRGRALQEVIDEVQPYTRRRIMVDPQAADLQYTGIVDQENVEAWVRDLPLIYPDVDVVDCRKSTYPVPGCFDPDRIVIRSRFSPLQNAQQSALR